MRSGRGSGDDRIERIVEFEERHFSSTLLLDSRYSERNPTGWIVLFFRGRVRIVREDDQRCPCSAYFEFVTETSLANRVCQEHLIGRGQVFERFRTYRRRSVYFHPFTLPDCIRLIKRWMKNRFRRIRNLYDMGAAGNQGAKEEAFKRAPRTLAKAPGAPDVVHIRVLIVSGDRIHKEISPMEVRTKSATVSSELARTQFACAVPPKANTPVSDFRPRFAFH